MPIVHFPGNDNQTLNNIQWVKFRNDAGSQAPAGAILRITGFNVSDPEEGFFTIGQPNTYGSQDAHAINDDLPVEPGKFGRCCIGQMAPALYDTGDGTPTFGIMLGPQNGTWKLRAGTGGFRFMGQISVSEGRVLVVPSPMITVRGVPSGDVAPGGTDASFAVYIGTFGAEAPAPGSPTLSVTNLSSCTVAGSALATALRAPDNSGWQFAIGNVT